MTVEESAAEADAPTVSITIHGVPLELRNELSSRAALEGRSRQQYLLELLRRTVWYPPKQVLLQSIRERKRASGTRLSVEEILNARDADRR